MAEPTLVHPQTVPLERWSDPARGSIGWQTLLSAGLTPSHAMTCGIATLEPGEDFALHCHAEPELYFAIEGMAQIIVDGIPHLMMPESALFIPGGALHGIPAVTTRFRYFYCFATDSFSQIVYEFLPTAAALAAPLQAAAALAASPEAALHQAAPLQAATLPQGPAALQMDPPQA
jgi:mannose-6-phosphate isomerase-like protein (cupin superfamily)